MRTLDLHAAERATIRRVEDVILYVIAWTLRIAAALAFPRRRR